MNRFPYISLGAALLVLVGLMFLVKLSVDRRPVSQPGLTVWNTDANRLAHLNGPTDPYYPESGAGPAARLVTPQWIGEPDVDAVVLLSIDDMRESAPYEAYLRPILDRLAESVTGSPVTIFTNTIDPADPHLQQWLDEGLSIEVHTIDHPCPLLAKGDFAQSMRTVHQGIDLLTEIPNMSPVAYRMPCCDSMNSLSPRFFTEIFNRPTGAGNFLKADSSVFTYLTSTDPEIDPSLLLETDETGQKRERIQRYTMRDMGFENWIHNYPYPYPIGHLCWEFPSVMPSDWEAQHVRGKNHPDTVEDLKAVLDAVVQKRGIFTFVFHPHGWIENRQVIDLIDHGVATHGRRIRFLNFRQAVERLERNLLGGEALRDRETGSDNGVRLVDLNQDGYLDVLIGNDRVRRTRIWNPDEGKWKEMDLPFRVDSSVRFGVVDGKNAAMKDRDLWAFSGDSWQHLPGGDDSPLIDSGARLIDLDGDGSCELIFAGEDRRSVYQYEPSGGWTALPLAIPENVRFSANGNVTGGSRFLALEQGPPHDLLTSTPEEYAVHQFESLEKGWTQSGLSGARGTLPPGKEIPTLVREDGSDNGAWFLRGQLVVQNEDTSDLPGVVDRRTAEQLKTPIDAPTAPPESTAPGPVPETLDQTQALSPARALASLSTHDDLTVELVAAEPLVLDPIDIAWGIDGRLWVVEMADYPLGIDGKDQPGGRVRFLEDTDGDGAFDQSTVFLDGLPYPTGAMPWKKGVLIVAAPNLIYAEDQDGDGKADVSEIRFRGFGEGNQQHRVNGLQWGLDGWVYLANGDSGGTIVSEKTGDRLNLGGSDLRVRPDDGLLDRLAGQTQFGRNRDDSGRWFGCNNSNPLWHYVLEDRYLRRNPHVPTPRPLRHLPEVPGNAPVFPTSPTVERFNDFHTANCITSACGTAIYRDDWIGPNYAGDAFICEPVHNLVHRQELWPDGPTFRSRRSPAEKAAEFLRSTDPWFRPVSTRTGPDGALYVTDMYRQVIEHPEWIPHEWEARLDLRSGADRGRIYRVRSKSRPGRTVPDLSTAEDEALVAAFLKRNGILRDLIHQKILWEERASVLPHFKKASATHEDPGVRLQALWILRGLGGLEEKEVVKALADPEPMVRRQAIRLAESLTFTSSLETALGKCLNDSDAAVRLQLANSLGEWEDAGAGALLTRLVAGLSDGENYLVAGAMSSATEHLPALIEGVTQSENPLQPQVLTRLLQTALGSGEHLPGHRILDCLANQARQAPEPWHFGSVVEAFEGASPDEREPYRDRFETLYRIGRPLLDSPDLSDALKEKVIQAFSLGRPDGEKNEYLTKYLQPTEAPSIQQAALNSLSVLYPDSFAPDLLDSWVELSPSLQRSLLSGLVTREPWALMLLQRIEDESKPTPREIPSRLRLQLQNHPAEAVATQAGRVFASMAGTSRFQIADQYREAAVSLQGNSGAGRAIFRKQCVVCHALEGVGKNVGPDLAALTDRSLTALATAIFHPNDAVEDKYLSYAVRLASEEILLGMLASETSENLNFTLANGTEKTVLRKNLISFESTGLSLMPEGLEGSIDHQAFADLAAYLGQARPARKTFEFNEPTEVFVDGPTEIKVTAASIHGPSLVFERRYLNLGDWCHVQDQAVWELSCTRPGRYQVTFDFACDRNHGGNRFALTIGSQRLEGEIPGTGNWNAYERREFGQIEVPEGDSELVIRSDGPIEGYLMDLRAVILTPVSN
ncbi:MAG: PVC-type heme-binding CxxCH protein [Verrucomicrobiota bacterium]